MCELILIEIPCRTSLRCLACHMPLFLYTSTHTRITPCYDSEGKLKCALTRMHTTEFLLNTAQAQGTAYFFAYIKWYLLHIKFTKFPRTFPTRYSHILLSAFRYATPIHTPEEAEFIFHLKGIKILNSRARPLIPTLVHTLTCTCFLFPSNNN